MGHRNHQQVRGCADGGRGTPEKGGKPHRHQDRGCRCADPEGNTDQNGKKQYDDRDIVDEGADQSAYYQSREQRDARLDLLQPGQGPPERLQRACPHKALPCDHQCAYCHQRFMPEVFSKLMMT